MSKAQQRIISARTQRAIDSRLPFSMGHSRVLPFPEKSQVKQHREDERRQRIAVYQIEHNNKQGLSPEARLPSFAQHDRIVTADLNARTSA